MTVVSPARPNTSVAALRRSPLADHHAGLPLSTTAVELSEERFLTQVNVRVSPHDPAATRIEHAIELRLPREPNRVSGDERNAALWLGPDEWLVIAPDGAAERVATATRAAFGGAPGSTVDVSANRTTLRLSGPRSRDVLEKVCALDLHPRAFGPGQCAQTLLGRTQAVLWQVDTGSPEPAYRLLVRSSFACYLADLLLDAMAEFTHH